MITKSRWPKFTAWQSSLIKENCKTVLYIYGVIVGRPGWQGNIIKLSRQVYGSDVGLAMTKHVNNVTTISDENNRIIEIKKKLKENVDASMAWMRAQEDFVDEVQIYQCTYFLYDVSNEIFQNAKTFFWNHYSQELDSWRDQPLMAYTLYHFQIKPLNFPVDNIMKIKWSLMGNNRHKNDLKDN